MRTALLTVAMRTALLTVAMRTARLTVAMRTARLTVAMRAALLTFAMRAALLTVAIALWFFSKLEARSSVARAMGVARMARTIDAAGEWLVCFVEEARAEAGVGARGEAGGAAANESSHQPRRKGRAL